VITRSGALERTENRIIQLTDEALGALAGIGLEREAAEVLTGLAAVATHRKG
jgi:geranylgeranyl diphosphate synthase type I